MKREIEDHADQSQLLDVGPCVRDGFIIDCQESWKVFRHLVIGIIAASVVLWSMAAWFVHRDQTLKQKYGADPASHVWYDDGGN